VDLLGRFLRLRQLAFATSVIPHLAQISSDSEKYDLVDCKALEPHARIVSPMLVQYYFQYYMVVPLCPESSVALLCDGLPRGVLVSGLLGSYDRCGPTHVRHRPSSQVTTQSRRARTVS
jgi:hypothetical protein